MNHNNTMPLESIQPAEQSPVSTIAYVHNKHMKSNSVSPSRFTRIRQNSLSSIDSQLFSNGFSTANDTQSKAYVPYSENIKSFQSSLRTPMAYETFTVISMLSCTDSLLYYLSFLPIKILISLAQYFKSAILSFGQSQFNIHSRYIHTLLQGIIILVVLCVTSLLQDYAHIDTYTQINAITWTRLYVLFNIFNVVEMILERIGIKLNGHLNYAAINSVDRIKTACMSIIYVLVHCWVIQLQISTLHSAFDQSNELLSLLSSLKVSDIKDGTRTDWNRSQLFRGTLVDVSQRFKWCLFVLIVGVQKCLRLYPITAPSTLHTTYYDNVVDILDQYSKIILNPSILLQYANHIATYLDQPRQLAKSTVMFIFSPYVYSDVVNATSAEVITKSSAIITPSSHNVYLSLHNVWSRVVGTTKSTNITATFDDVTNYQHTLNVGSSDILNQQCSMGLVDAFDAYNTWLPTFLYNVATIIVILILIDWLKHATISLYNKSITSDTYRSFCKQVSVAYIESEPLGIDDNKDVFTASHFDFLAMPLAVIVIRELWHLTLALVNSCMFGRWTHRLLGVNLVISPSSLHRCKYYAQLTQSRDINVWSSSKSVDTLAVSHIFLYSVMALLCVRACVFIWFCCIKICTRILIRGFGFSYMDTTARTVLHYNTINGSHTPPYTNGTNTNHSINQPIHTSPSMYEIVRNAFSSPQKK